uniref:Uncharacterized protein n=1 Tax=Utricularia reniformis TaxID=192314 RepID=A0A1Y0AYQ9_9LAMI|nr:hypothetical protein AEK19_MT0454 [Utricularia reniformis]ART30289.1 hypothetical protein AEK19_MT0454 [Utricularia reniformis]
MVCLNGGVFFFFLSFMFQMKMPRMLMSSTRQTETGRADEPAKSLVGGSSNLC